jgi:cytidine deaminase
MNANSAAHLHVAAKQLASRRYPNEESIVAAMLTSSGRILTSVYAEAVVDAACLCAETGAICEAHKLGEAVVASLCLRVNAATGTDHVLPACGVCQERLAYWGLNVLVAVPPSKSDHHDAPAVFKSLRELRPHYWNSDA